jgi:hypothetical protein
MQTAAKMPNELPAVPHGCDAEVFTILWLEGYPVWHCEKEARAAGNRQGAPERRELNKIRRNQRRNFAPTRGVKDD